MYGFKITADAKADFKSLFKKRAISPGITNKFKSLSENPLKIAKPTGKPILGDYYVNAGNRFCMTFRIDEQNKIVKILRIHRQSYLYKLLTGKL